MVGWGSGGLTGTVVAVAAATDALAFETRFRDLFRAAMRVAFRITGDRSVAEDLAAEAMARAYANWSKIRGSDHLDAWVRRVAANLALDVVRRRRPLAEAARREHDDLRARRTISIPFEEDAASREEVTRALAALPRRQREVLVLRYLAGLDDDELCDVLGMTASTARTHAQRGLATLRERLGVELEGAVDVRG